MDKDRSDILAKTMSTHPDQQDLAELLAKLSAKVESGQVIDWEKIYSRYPNQTLQLDEIRPAMEALQNLKFSDERASQLPTTGFENDRERDLGDFRILREIGRGGMGVVYEAEQLSVSRRVALKVLPLASLFDRRSLQRFHNEVRAAATLEHPNIVRVISAGEDRGVHYYAMQLVRGQSLAAVIRELALGASEGCKISARSMIQAVNSGVARSESLGDPLFDDDDTACSDTQAKGRSATLPGTVEQSYYRDVTHLAIQAARALQHAHDHGVTHRDIKPGNLLIDREGKVHVADFGLARIETDAAVTRTGDVLGTLRYMSPEQVLAQRVVVDHRSDIYSLGATVFELLTLQPLHGGQNRAEIIKQISLFEPRSTRSVNRNIPIELDTIVLECLNRDPADRYQTADELADDLQRFLDQVPIRARRATVAQIASKWCRRNAVLIWTGLICAIVALSVGSAAAWQQMRVAQREAETSKRRLNMAMDILDEFLFSNSAQELMADRYGHRTEEGLERQRIYGELLAKATPLYEQIAREAALADDVVEQVHSLLQAARACLARYEEDAALDYSKAAERLARASLESAPDGLLFRKLLGTALSLQSSAHWLTNNRQGSLKASSEAIEQLNSIRNAYSNNEQFRSDLWQACSMQAIMLAKESKFDQCLPIIEMMLQDAEWMAARHPDHGRQIDNLAWGYFCLGELLYRNGDRKAAATSFQHEINFREKQYEAGLFVYLPWALVSCADASMRDIERAMELGEKHDLPHVLGLAEYQRDNLEAARKHLLRADKVTTDIHKGFFQAQVRLFLSMIFARQGDSEKARHWYEKAVKVSLEKHAPNPYEFARFRVQALDLLESAERKRNSSEQN